MLAILVVILASLAQQPRTTFRSTSVMCTPTQTTSVHYSSPSMRYGRTAGYVDPSIQARYTVPIAAASLREPFSQSSSYSPSETYSPDGGSGPRRAWSDPNGDYGDDPTPGYDPADPMMPIGDTPWLIMLSLGILYIFRKIIQENLRKQKNIVPLQRLLKKIKQQ